MAPGPNLLPYRTLLHDTVSDTVSSGVTQASWVEAGLEARNW